LINLSHGIPFGTGKTNALLPRHQFQLQPGTGQGAGKCKDKGPWLAFDWAERLMAVSVAGKGKMSTLFWKLMEPEGFVPRHSTLLLVLEGLFNQGSGQTSFNLLASWVITFGKAPDTPSRSPVPSTAKPRRCKAGTEVGKGVQAPWKGQKKARLESTPAG
jgi:hypothetical protein